LPLLQSSRSVSACLQFFHWCSLREEAQALRRAGAPRPWAKHPLLASHHFCNVSRLEDRGTLSFHAFLRAQRVSSLAGVLWCSLIYRRLNRLATFTAWQRRLPLPEDAAAWCEWLERRAEQKEGPIFTCKHQTSGGLSSYLDTVRGLAGLHVPPQSDFPRVQLLAEALQRCENARDAVATLKAVRHVGTFIGWQVLCDLVEAGVLPAVARDDWVALGPGAKAWLTLIFGDSYSTEPAAAEEDDLPPGFTMPASASPRAAPRAGEALSMERMRCLQAAQPWALKALGRPTHGIVRAEEGAPPLLLRDLEHSLCEFSKWIALRRGSLGPGSCAEGLHPLPPPLTVLRLEGSVFRVQQPAAAEGEGAVCAAFPEGATVLPREGEAPIWLPSGSGAAKRKRPAKEGESVRSPKQAKAPRPERAAMLTWFASSWPGLESAGWRVVSKTREAGATAGTSDSYWVSPQGKRFRSRVELAAFHGIGGEEKAGEK
jgi:hypothetical protein